MNTIKNFVTCRTEDGTYFTMPLDHPILKKGIFKALIDMGERIAMDPNQFLKIVFYDHLKNEDILETLQFILQFSIKDMEDTLIHNWIENLSEEFKSKFLTWDVDIRDVINGIDGKITQELMFDGLVKFLEERNILRRRLHKEKMDRMLEVVKENPGKISFDEFSNVSNSKKYRQAFF